MKVKILMTLTLILCLTLPQCFANHKEVPGGSDDISNLNCDFDEGDMCGWDNLHPDPLTWEAKRGNKSSSNSWGHTDYTTGNSSGRYGYLYTNDSHEGSKGRLSSHLLSAGPRKGRCLTFYYNMFQTDGVFKVIMKYNDSRTQTVLQRDSSQGNAWLKATVSLLSKRPFSIIFEHARGSLDVETGLAIDDVAIIDKQCPSRLNSCGTNIYGSRKKRDLGSLLKALLEEKKHIKNEEKKEQKEELDTEKKEKEKKMEKRSTGGTPLRKDEFPWIVHIRIFSDRSILGKYSQCGGSIIDNEWILSAASCFESGRHTTINAEKIRVYLGEHNINTEEVEESQFVLVPEKVIIHPDRGNSGNIMPGHQYDLALLKLKYKLTFTDSVNAVCLPDSMFSPGTRCVAAGWGLDESGDTSDILLHLTKVIQSDYSCSYRINEDMICAIVPSGVSDVCQGDIGGPLVCKRSQQYQLAGTVSFGDACANKNRTSGVYADIYYFMPWIMSTITYS